MKNSGFQGPSAAVPGQRKQNRLRMGTAIVLAYLVSSGTASAQKLDYAAARVERRSPPAQLTRDESPVVLPIEILGANGTTVTRRFNIPESPNLNRRLKLWLEIHALRYETEASLQLNNGPWTPINSNTVTIQGLGAAFGGIGGGFSTLKMTMNLRIDDVHAGMNTLAFRFNETDGLQSGFRVLNFNIVASNGAQLLPQTSFAQDDPSKWQPPLKSPADIQMGKTLWNTAHLVSPGFGAIQAKCGSCHAQDGRDLKYFNYSNLSIRARSMFHGLSAHEGDQIASYIRSLNTPNPGRPWNPPYQPGPGLDAQPVSDWAAGAGLDAVLDSDAEMLPYLAPGGSTAGWSANSYLNVREIPLAIQLPDWNSWLPAIHPVDGFGASFATSDLNLDFPIIRSKLRPNSPTAYRAALDAFHDWFVARSKFEVGLTAITAWDARRRTVVYSLARWGMVKNWELNQEFGLEGMPQIPFGAKSDVRGWIGNEAFFTAPLNVHVHAGPGLGNGSAMTPYYLSLAWYQVQLILNDGQGEQSDHDPIDYPYATSFVMDLYARQARLPGIMLELEWNIKALQEVTLTGTGPEAGSLGWAPYQTSPGDLLLPAWLPLWSATDSGTRTRLLQAYTQYWFEQASKYTPEQYHRGGWANGADNPATLSTLTFGGVLWHSLPQLRRFRVDPGLTNRIADWAATIWPKGNWASEN